MVVTEVISSISGFGLPWENFIPWFYYNGRGRLCKAEIQPAFLPPVVSVDGSLLFSQYVIFSVFLFHHISHRRHYELRFSAGQEVVDSLGAD